MAFNTYPKKGWRFIKPEEKPIIGVPFRVLLKQYSHEKMQRERAIDLSMKEHKIKNIAEILPHKTRNFSAHLQVGAKLERVMNTSSGFANSNVRDPFMTMPIAKTTGHCSPGVGRYTPIKGTELRIRNPRSMSPSFVSGSSRFLKTRFGNSGALGPAFQIDHLGSPLMSTFGASSIRNTRGKPEDWLMPLGLPQEAGQRPSTPLSLKEVKKNRLEAHLSKFRQFRGGHDLLLSTMNNKLARYPSNIVKLQTSTIGPGAYDNGQQWIKDEKRPSSTFLSAARRSGPNEWSLHSVPSQPVGSKARIVASVLRKKLPKTRIFDDSDDPQDGSSPKLQHDDKETHNTEFVADLTRNPKNMQHLMLELNKIKTEVALDVRHKDMQQKRRIALAMNTVRGANTFMASGASKTLREARAKKIASLKKLRKGKKKSSQQEPMRKRRTSPTHKRRRPDTASKKTVRTLTRQMKQRHSKNMTRSDRIMAKAYEARKSRVFESEDALECSLFSDPEDGDQEFQYL